jgi:Arm DNA-binding domain
MAKNDGACANPKQIRTDVDCRAARPKFDKGAWSPAKISDVTGGWLYLLVTPDVSRPGNAASKLWRMDYRFHGRQKTYSIGPYGNGKDGTFSLAEARHERDKAKDLIKEGKDPSIEKQLDKHRQAAARPFGQWADEWLARKKVEKVKRGRMVAVRDPKTSRSLSCASAASRLASASCAGRTSSVRTCSLSCVHMKPRENWKPGTECAASVSKSATMPMLKAMVTIHSAT